METKRKSTLQYLSNGDITLNSAVRNKKTGAVTVYITANRILLPWEKKTIEDDIRAELGCVEVSCRYDFNECIARIEANEEAAAQIRELWCELAPQISPILSRSRVELHGHEYVFFVPMRYFKVMEHQGVSEFRTLLLNEYGWNAALRVVGDAGAAGDSEELEKTVNRDWGGKPQPKRTVRKAQARMLPKDIILGREILKPEIVKMSELNDKTGRVTVRGEIQDIEFFESPKSHKFIFTVSLSDRTNTIFVKLFPDSAASSRIEPALKKAWSDADALTVRGNFHYDGFLRDYCLFADDINISKVERRQDTAQDKRVELHLHTQMSAMDATTKLSSVVELAAKWGHKAVAITDHGVVHSFPEAKKAAKKNNIKVIFGCEGYLLPDCRLIPLAQEYCAVALIHVGKKEHARVFELAAYRTVKDGSAAETFHTAVNPGVPITSEMKELTGFSQDDIESAPKLAEAVRMLAEFSRGAVLVAHGGDELRLIDGLLGDNPLSPRYVSTQMLMQYLHREVRPREPMCRPYLNAADAAEWTAKTLVGLIREMESGNIAQIPELCYAEENDVKRHANHIVLLAATQKGLKNLYKLVSYSNLDHFYKTPRMPKSLISFHREGIILGTACEAGELFRSIVSSESLEKQIEIASWYDYLEIQPIANNAFLVRDGKAKDDEQLRDYNRRIVELGERLGKPVVATGDVHFLEPEDSIFRAILMSSMGYKDAVNQAPLYFKTTQEMLEEFSYLGEAKAREVVIDNPNLIASMCGQLRPFLDERQTYSPELPGAAEELKSLAVTRAYELYGDPLPDIVEKRLNRELDSIIGNGYSSLYMVAQKLVSKSVGDGYLVGSRGSVGSSFVAFLARITEVNALPAHYRCPKCKYSEFPEIAGNSRCGIDLPEKQCPVCSARLDRDGYEIPFEVFLGFKGDKTPDIDLNFSGEYQPVAHKFTEDMFGEGHAFRAGTITGVQDKTVYGYVMHFCEENRLTVSDAEKARLVKGCLGVKKTTGQHPGGIVIVPDDLEIYDFCPVQHPADKTDAESITTHFDFHALDDKLVKLDILGHDDPTALKMLKDLTGLDPRSIGLDDAETMSLFSSDMALGISLDTLGCDIGCLGVPEFGTGFVRGMLMDTRPTTMEELVRIAGLSHGEDVWLNNAQELIRDGTATLMEVICTRDDIMNYLISRGCEPSFSFKTMESVRKGRGLTSDMETTMHEHDIPQWFIDSCKKIKYMFPRAHAAAYVMMSFRIAYYKVHYPLAYYCVYFTVRADTFDIERCLGGAGRVLGNIKELKGKDKLDKKESDQLIILEIVYEMNIRGIELLPIDIYKSAAVSFTVEDGKLRPPFNSIAGLGNNAAIGIAEAAKHGEFISREDFIRRSKANSAVVEGLDRLHCLDFLPQSNQTSMF